MVLSNSPGHDEYDHEDISNFQKVLTSTMVWGKENVNTDGPKLSSTKLREVK